MFRAISRSYDMNANVINMPDSLRVIHSHSSSIFAMAKIAQVLTLLSLISRAFAVTAYLYDVIQCPSNIYISTTCSNLPQSSCCIDYFGVRSICFLHFIFISLSSYNSIISRARYSSMSETITLSWEPTATVMAPGALQQNQQSVQSVSGHFRVTS